MVFESIVTDLMNRFLGDFIENLDHKQLNIGIWGGECIRFQHQLLFIYYISSTVGIGIYMVLLTSSCQNVVHISLLFIDFFRKWKTYAYLMHVI